MQLVCIPSITSANFCVYSLKKEEFNLSYQFPDVVHSSVVALTQLLHAVKTEEESIMRRCSETA